MVDKVSEPTKKEVRDIQHSLKYSQKDFDVKSRELLDKSEVSLILDTYDDIFSDFDPRPYSERGLSEDFLFEAKRRTRDTKSEQIELTLLIPSKVKNVKQELVIEKRLHNHFQKHYKMLHKDVNRIKTRGFFLTIIGTFLVGLATFLYPMHGGDVVVTFLIVLLEPAGWFTSWTGLEHIFYTWTNEKLDLEFYEKISKSKISFLPY